MTSEPFAIQSSQTRESVAQSYTNALNKLLPKPIGETGPGGVVETVPTADTISGENAQLT